jgi:hypothetical protein
MGPNPNGVAPLVPRMMNNERGRLWVTDTVGRNPFRVAANDRRGLGAAPSPRVAEYGNPGLSDVTPSGLLRKTPRGCSANCVGGIAPEYLRVIEVFSSLLGRGPGDNV